MARVLVTGGNGFIGSHLCRALIERGHAVRVLDLPGARTDATAGLDVEQVPGSILNEGDLDRAMAGVDCVYHLAALVMDWGRRADFERLNVGGTENVVDAAVRAGAKQIVLMSSLAIHGWSDHLNADETEPADVHHSYPYGMTKRLTEELVNGACERGLIAGTIVRPGFFPFGPSDRTSFARLAAHMGHWYFSLVGRGDKRVCVSYVENLVRGMALCCLNDAAYGETFVLADDGVHTWAEVFTAIARALGVRPPKPGLPAGVLYAIAWAMDRLWLVAGAKNAPPLTRYRININRYDFHFRADKAKRLLGYSPDVSFEEGMARTVAWYRDSATER